MTPQDANDVESVQTAEDFAAYLRLLAEDYAADVRDHRDEQFPTGDWAHWDLGAFLEAWAAFMQATPTGEPSWQNFARQLNAARSYE